MSGKFSHRLRVAPLLALLAAASIASAGFAGADDGDDYDNGSSPFYSPDTYASPATEWVPWASGLNEGLASAPSVDTTVHCDDCAG